jgi:hypothetical protein
VFWRDRRNGKKYGPRELRKGCEKLRSENVKGFKIVSGSNTRGFIPFLIS